MAAPAAAPSLPLALPDAVVRTFDTPDFAGMTFYEVRAKSIINRVPGASRVPFDWTVNPYRGCTHACSYCLSGDTPILMADGRTKPLADLRVGDRIYGTAGSGAHRRYVPTEVLAHWSTVKPAYRITLADGTSLVASGDHRFLTPGGWKHVTDHPDGTRRPHLTRGQRLMGVGGLAAPPKESAEYQRGYLAGTIRGEGILASYAYSYGRVHRFRLALADREVVDRVRRYLGNVGVQVASARPGPAGAARRERHAIRTSKVADVVRIRELVARPEEPSEGWRLGFLAGIFDVRGGADGTVRVAAGDDLLLEETTAALHAAGFEAALEDERSPDGARVVRLSGGLRERLRFVHRTDPATGRRLRIDGAAIGSDGDLRVSSIEPLGLDLPLYDITTGTGDFVANGVVSHNCFARNTHTYLDLDAGRDFDTKVVVKVNAGELVRRELGARKWRGEHIAMGTNVDCYQRAEGRYRLMPPILTALRDFANPFSILTKGTLILRDLPLLRQAAEVTRVSLSFSVGFVDERLWRSVESGTPSPRRRLDAVRRFTDAGFRVGVLMAPILPGLTDTDDSIEETVAAIAASGAVSVTPLPLHLRPGAREWYAGWLGREFPRLVPRYRELFGTGSYQPQSHQREVVARVRMAARRYGLNRAEPGTARDVPEPTPGPEQLTLL